MQRRTINSTLYETSTATDRRRHLSHVQHRTDLTRVVVVCPGRVFFCAWSCVQGLHSYYACHLPARSQRGLHLRPFLPSCARAPRWHCARAGGRAGLSALVNPQSRPVREVRNEPRLFRALAWHLSLTLSAPLLHSFPRPSGRRCGPVRCSDGHDTAGRDGTRSARLRRLLGRALGVTSGPRFTHPQSLSLCFSLSFSASLPFSLGVSSNTSRRPMRTCSRSGMGRDPVRLPYERARAPGAEGKGAERRLDEMT